MKSLAFAVLMIAFIAIAVGCAQTPATQDPLAVIRAFHDAQNAKNVTAAMALVADDAVFKNAPPSSATLTGKDQIRTWLQGQVDRNNQVEVSNLQVSGDKVTWDSKVTRGGSQIATSSVEAIVQGGKIKSFTFK